MKNFVSQTVSTNSKVLDIGSYDGYVVYDVLKTTNLSLTKEIHLLDLYPSGKIKLKPLVKHNIKLFEKEFKNKHFKVISSDAENMLEKIDKKYDQVGF